MEELKQIRVDNWGVFFLQRLQIFFNKTDFCDLTLQFEQNVQLKVHRLVMSACTEYFQVLEQTCDMVDDVLIMPSDLQADVVLPIVNFMYTGILEYDAPLYEKLYQTANLMNIVVLTKLLDAQKAPIESVPLNTTRKSSISPVPWNCPEKKIPKIEPELPATLPGRKLPVWKRKTVPVSPKIPPNYFTEQKRQTLPIDPLASVDNTPKPTRFEWPEEDLHVFSMLDPVFNDISYTSKPLVTQSDEPRPSTSFDSVLIKNDLLEDDDENLENEENYTTKEVNKRKNDFETIPAKRVCLTSNEKDNQSKIVSKISGKSPSLEIDHAKIISEVLKKYPGLVKKNKNIRLKILAKGNSSINSVKKVSRLKQSQDVVNAHDDTQAEQKEENGPWHCPHCSNETESVEFITYYLYRKHMTDVHFEQFDSPTCKFCGHKSTKHSLLLYHQFKKHGVKPPLAYNFPKCKQCPYIALNQKFLTKHAAKHGKAELHCVDCNILFANQQALTSHLEITGHNSKSAKSTHDCQYCGKKFQSSTTLHEHIKQNHKNESISSIDEPADEEYILPDQLSDCRRDKIKILSDVKLPIMDAQQQTVALEPSSEAEALNNVATGIATSLGLVDVVVLDDNQQYILHADNQQNISGGESTFIVPDLQHTETFTEAHNQVVSPGQNTMLLHNTDISSTDELVMVLTDQDYRTDHSELLEGNHSNILVVYSHPVGQTNQFVSAGNIVLTTQSGLIDLRNTDTIVTSSNSTFMVPSSQVSVSTHIESIESIQREIDQHPYEKKCEIKDELPLGTTVEVETVGVQTLQDDEPVENIEDVTVLEQNQPPPSEENCTIVDDLMKHPKNACSSDEKTEIEDSVVSEEDTATNLKTTDSEATKESLSTDTNVLHSEDTKCTEEITEQSDGSNNTGIQEVDQDVQMQEIPEEKTLENLDDEPETLTDQITSVKHDLNGVENQSDLRESTIEIEQSIEKLQTQYDCSVQQVMSDALLNSETVETSTLLESNLDQQPEAQSDMHLEFSTVLPEPKSNSNVHEDSEQLQLSPTHLEQYSQYNLHTPIQDVAPLEDILQSQSKEVELLCKNACESQTKPENNCEVEKEDAVDSKESTNEALLSNDKSSSLIKKYKSSINRKTAKIILDDWDDTDSQQSDSKNILNVNKLIDDWDDEEDEGKNV